MLEHMFTHKRRCLLSGANKATSTTQDANRRVNGKVCHAETNVRLVGRFRVGWVLEWRARAPSNIGTPLWDRALPSLGGVMEIAMSRARLFPVVLISALV